MIRARVKAEMAGMLRCGRGPLANSGLSSMKSHPPSFRPYGALRCQDKKAKKREETDDDRA